MEQSIKVLQKYYPASVSDIAAYSPGSLLRFSCIISRFHRLEDGWFLFIEHDNLTLAIFLSNDSFNQNEAFIKECFSPYFEKLGKIQGFLKSVHWGSWTITVYGQIILIDEDTPNVYLEAHYFWPQTFQAELDEKRIKPTEKLVVNKVTENQVKDFKQRIEAISKLFRGK